MPIRDNEYLDIEGHDNESLNRVIGRGMRYPDLFSRKSGGVAIREGVNKINQAISNLLSTRQGERVLRPNYGSRIHGIVFEPLDEATLDLISIYIQEALETWEPRIVVRSVRAEIHPHREHTISARIHYRVRNTNLEEVFTYHYNPEGLEF